MNSIIFLFITKTKTMNIESETHMNEFHKVLTKIINRAKALHKKNYYLLYYRLPSPNLICNIKIIAFALIKYLHISDCGAKKNTQNSRASNFVLRLGVLLPKKNCFFLRI